MTRKTTATMKVNDLRSAQLEILNRLIYLHLYRSKGYDRAVSKLQNQGPLMGSIVYSLRERAKNSRVFRAELCNAVLQLGGLPIDRASLRGRMARAWLMIKSAVAPGSAPFLFDVPEYGDKTIISAYDEALQMLFNWPDEIYAMLNRHWLSLRRIHEIGPGFYQPEIVPKSA